AKLAYTVTVVNKDSATCAAATFTPTSTAPTGWTTAFSAATLKLNPGATGNFTLTKTIPAGTAVNTYSVNVNLKDANHNTTAAASAKVTAATSTTPPTTSSAPALTLTGPSGTVAVATYTTLTAKVVSGGLPVVGTMVGFMVKQPNGMTSITVGITNATGVASSVFKNTSAGSWSATASAAVSSQNLGSNTITWTVN
ncbi:MAG: hypothetical protein J0L64_19755, partial [Acidobacteria bacterium]|nr:hypothetical protein [Acidobacteriota bacterium]